MKSLRRLSVNSLASLLVALTLPMACQNTSGVLTGSQASSTSTSEGAITGALYTGTATDGRLVPPKEVVSIEILDKNNKVLSTTQTDQLGNFFLRNIPIQANNEKTGEEVIVRIQRADYSRSMRLFPGRVINLSAIQMVSEAPKEQAQSITGILLDPNQTPLSGILIRDKEFSFRSATTDANGRFVLDVVSDQVEIVLDDSSLPFTINVSEFKTKQIVTLDTNNVRSVSGIIQDSTNSNIFLNKVKVKIAGTSISATTNNKGEFSMNGAPLGPFTLEAEAIDGYTGTAIQVRPAEIKDGKPTPVKQNLNLRPVGSVQINFKVEDAPGFGDPNNNPNIPPLGCVVGFNCANYDLNGDGTMEDVYHNSLGVRTTDTAGKPGLETLVNIEGTDITRQISYPPAPVLDLKGTDALGEVKIFPQAVVAPNIVYSIVLDNVPGGRQNITISMTGMQTQKSISVFIPPKDTISTDLITLFRVRPVMGVGDVKGKLVVINEKGEDISSKINFNNLKVAYVDIADSEYFSPTGPNGALERNPDLLRRIKDSLTNADRSVRLSNNSYYLKNVSTGSRVMVVAGLLTDTDEVLADCFVPNSATLLNVRPGVVNFAPDLSLTLRPLPGCGG
ncbi:hypothetical protein COW36_23545 [bacterium (Candidatus Blackallbacteria) CG17_big_fil_post_rev_8_21_14_2_50_48_46]|uniref:Carboxypeptidase regulatory-like domain-containing protein n=1 Tax=bacterium (Candidatus Blackallbacteria) CG17_big_fil_post_rev_8_21_14_2_50_48_46 TaxID=2014261 RepID=A0A2M7FXK0_9BACT|nr:MAG: hypothetical protein COW64_17755 [bacterium (Candidatus Blackallbacteria) CG18_big_fil_WC_8_21_14_2_50_49_26]PIW14015.1 MAG: hypothetical protein COW36_23545 [bacterium (Candidatus Blackallbacteria) CG17_big_fil_post_rev_8_21_14_2_50_48_46]PIW46867.1 MAG: hypothetical protein COW20_14720 [bacterium (Candidatus Blackallbacteria) CG13_big_fil_rev_8_21_14_2_50_49_14]